jgi:hypothetical protein
MHAVTSVPTHRTDVFRDESQLAGPGHPGPGEVPQ